MIHRVELHDGRVAEILADVCIDPSGALLMFRSTALVPMAAFAPHSWTLACPEFERISWSQPLSAKRPIPRAL